MNRNIKRTNKGCVDAIKAPKPLSTNFKAHTKTPFPYIKKKKDAISEFNNCFLEIFTSCFKIRDNPIMITPATKKRMDAKKNGGNAVTAILLKR